MNPASLKRGRVTTVHSGVLLVQALDQSHDPRFLGVCLVSKASGKLAGCRALPTAKIDVSKNAVLAHEVKREREEVITDV